MMGKTTAGKTTAMKTTAGGTGARGREGEGQRGRGGVMKVGRTKTEQKAPAIRGANPPIPQPPRTDSRIENPCPPPPHACLVDFV